MGHYEEISRRRLLQLGSGLGVAGLLAACGGNTTGSGSGGDVTPAAGGGSVAPTLKTFDASTETGQLVAFDWQGYEIPEFWKGYNDTQGKKVPIKWVFLEDDQQALAKVKAGFQVDTAHPCIAYTRDWNDAGLIQPWNTAQIKGWETVNPDLYEAGTIDNQVYMVPWDWGYSSLAIRTDRVDPADFTGWEGILNEKYKKRVSIYADGVAIIKIGHLINKGSVDPNELTAADIDAAKTTMIKAAKVVRNWWTSEADAIKDFVAGNVDVTYAWPGTWWQIRNGLKEKGVDPNVVQYIQPTQGRLGWVCGFVLAKDTKVPGSAHLMMSQGISDEAMVYLINAYAYGGSNASPAVLQKATPELVKAFGLDDPNSLKPPKVWKERFLPNRAAVVKAAEEVKASQ